MYVCICCFVENQTKKEKLIQMCVKESFLSSTVEKIKLKLRELAVGAHNNAYDNAIDAQSRSENLCNQYFGVQCTILSISQNTTGSTNTNGNTRFGGESHGGAYPLQMLERPTIKPAAKME